MITRIGRIFFLLLGSLAGSAAMAQDSGAQDSAAQDTGDIKVTLQPYVWVPTLTGSASLGPVSAPVRVEPKDFVEGLEIGGMGRLKVERNNTFFYADAIVVDYDNRKFKPFFGQPLRSKIRYFDLGVGIQRQIGSLTVSPQIGVQHLYLMADVDGSLITARADGNWLSPTIGLAASLPVSKRLTVLLSGDAAGFGIGRSNYQNGSATLHYRFGRHWVASAGYRIAKGRYTSPVGLSVDLDGGGPMAGIAYEFSLSR